MDVNHKGIAITLVIVAILVILLLGSVLYSSLIKPGPSDNNSTPYDSTIACTKDSDCRMSCGWCANVNYLKSIPIPQCPAFNKTGNSCICKNNQCAVTTVSYDCTSDSNCSSGQFCAFSQCAVGADIAINLGICSPISAKEGNSCHSFYDCDFGYSCTQGFVGTANIQNMPLTCQKIPRICPV